MASSEPMVLLSEEKATPAKETCAVCALNAPKYTCPRCATRTCSLGCCKKHKSESGCSGQRDRTAFVDKAGFDEMALLSDYRFLEEQARLVDAAHRDPVVAAAAAGGGEQVSSFFDNLRKFVHAAFAVDLKFMPSESTRHKQNRTRFNRNAQLVIWSLELVFDLGASVAKIHTKANLFHSNETLRALLVRFHRLYANSLFQGGGGGREKQPLSESESQAVLLVLDAFKSNFQAVAVAADDSTSVHGLCVLVEEASAGRRTYCKLDLDQRLDQALTGRCIIEYPTLFVVKDEDLHKYPLTSSDGHKRGPSAVDSGQATTGRSAVVDSGQANSAKAASGQKRGPSPTAVDSGQAEASSSAKQLKTSDDSPKAPAIQRLVSQDYELEEGELD